MFLLVLKVPEKISFAHNSRSSFEFYLFSTVFLCACVCAEKGSRRERVSVFVCSAESLLRASVLSDLCVGAILNISSMIFQLLLFTP